MLTSVVSYCMQTGIIWGFRNSSIIFPANVITMVNIYKQLSICLNKSYAWALYLINMIEDSLVCQSTLKSCRSVWSVINILRGCTHSFMYSNVNILKKLLVANLPNYGINYYQNVKILTTNKPKPIASEAAPRHPTSIKFQPKLRPWERLLRIQKKNCIFLIRCARRFSGIIFTRWLSQSNVWEA